MDQSPVTPAPVVMRAVAGDVERLVGSLAGGAVRDLCHQELAGLAAAVRAEQAPRQHQPERPARPDKRVAGGHPVLGRADHRVHRPPDRL